MATVQLPEDFDLPRPILLNHQNFIAAPDHESFKANFGTSFPQPQFLVSDIGTTAVYDLLPPSRGTTGRKILIVHGLNTPALGMLLLARELQTRAPDAHVVLFDLWGHGLSSTPLQAHTPHIFHLQILQVLGLLQWTSTDVIGYSFGGATAASFAVSNPGFIRSVILLAPAGLLSETLIDDHLRGLLQDSRGREREARDAVLAWLEGGTLTVPDDWREHVEQGEAVAEALRHWQLQDHRGYPYSVLSIFRDGGASGRDADFRRLAQLHEGRLAVVLGDEDSVCSPERLRELGFADDDISVLPRADHGFVRSQSGKVGELLFAFWDRLEGPEQE